jgi:hypothetical protein
MTKFRSSAVAKEVAVDTSISQISQTGATKTMGWESINVNEIAVDNTAGGGKTFDPLPAGEYTLQLMGASESKYRAGSTDISTAVVDDTEFKGRRVFIDLPNPDQQAWATQVYARLVEALGATVAPFTNPIEELNRLANNGHSRFKAQVYIDTYPSNTKDAQGNPLMKSRNKINYRSIAPAA